MPSRGQQNAGELPVVYAHGASGMGFTMARMLGELGLLCDVPWSAPDDSADACVGVDLDALTSELNASDGHSIPSTANMTPGDLQRRWIFRKKATTCGSVICPKPCTNGNIVL